MEIIVFFIHSYLLMFLYELISAEKGRWVKWIVVLLMGILKYIAECFTYTRYLVPFILCTLLVLYSISIHSKNSNITNFKFAFISYGMDYVINLVLSSVCGVIAGLIQVMSTDVKCLFFGIGRLLVIAILYKNKNNFFKVKQAWMYQIGVIVTAVLIFTDQVIRVAYTTENKGYTNIAIACAYLVALLTILWLMDHYKMAKIQKMYAEDNKQMSQKLHRSKEILPMIANYASSMDAVQDEEMRKKLEAVCHDYGKELGGAEMSAELFETTGIDLVDLLLKTKITECVEQDIELDVFVGTQIHKDMKRLDIGDGEIARLIGDLLRNAIHAVNGLKNKMVLLLIVKDEDEHVLIRIYDSGIPFPPYVLERFGERGNTTWGTGNGLADLMDTLKRVHASIEINTEMAPGDVFTKEICICFDGEDRVKIPHKDI